MVNPNPISATAVRTHAMSVRSSAMRVRIQAKWLSDVTCTSKRPTGSSIVVIARSHAFFARVRAARLPWPAPFDLQDDRPAEEGSHDDEYPQRFEIHQCRIQCGGTHHVGRDQ